MKTWWFAFIFNAVMAIVWLCNVIAGIDWGAWFVALHVFMCGLLLTSYEKRRKYSA